MQLVSNVCHSHGGSYSSYASHTVILCCLSDSPSLVFTVSLSAFCVFHHHLSEQLIEFRTFYSGMGFDVIVILQSSFSCLFFVMQIFDLVLKTDRDEDLEHPPGYNTVKFLFMFGVACFEK
jgi:uncharacterized membrane protein